MNILAISGDRKAFEKGSAVRSRFLDYGSLVDQFHVIVFAKKKLGFKDESFSPNIFLYPTNSCTSLGYIWDALKKGLYLKKQNINIDVITTQDPFETGIAGVILARILGAKLQIQIHTDFLSPYFGRGSWVNRVRVGVSRYVISRADGIRVVSSRIKNSIERITPEGVSVTVLPVFIERKINGSDSEGLKSKYPQFEKHILMASRLSPEKNIALALESMKDIIVKHSKVGLIIVGAGPEETLLKKFVQDNNLTENVIFEGWSENLGPYYKTADVFVLTSNYEGYAMTVVEALYFGCPVIMTDVGCAGEDLIHGENGLVVPVGDVKALTRAISHVVTGGQVFKVPPPNILSKEEYLARYRDSWLGL